MARLNLGLGELDPLGGLGEKVVMQRAEREQSIAPALASYDPFAPEGFYGKQGWKVDERGEGWAPYKQVAKPAPDFDVIEDDPRGSDPEPMLSKISTKGVWIGTSIDTEGWISWPGGENPLPEAAVVEVKLRLNSQQRAEIVAYRIVSL